MDGRGRTFLLLQVFFYFFFFASAEETKQNCSQVECPGPLAYYHDMGCTPVYRNQGDCCAYKYNCGHLDARSLNKCYVRNRSYEFGEYASLEDMNSFDHECICAGGGNSTGFWCARVYNSYRPFDDRVCWMKRVLHEFDPEIRTCPENETEIPRCVMEGITHMVGESFRPLNEPEKLCMCREDDTGGKIEPVCVTPNVMCTPNFNHREDIDNKYALIYNWDENPATNCSSSWRRQNANDAVIPNPNGPTVSGGNSSGGEDLICKFGNLTMNIGDELNQNTGYDSECVRCVCEVPPMPTCKRLNDDDCISANT